MTSFCVDKSVLGTTQHLMCIDGALSWVEAPPDDALRWMPTLDPYATDSLNVALNLGGRDVKWTFEQKYVQALAEVIPGFMHDPKAVPWRMVAPARYATASTKRLLSDIKASLDNSTVDYYRNIFVKQTDLFRSLRPFKVNGKALEKHIESEVNGKVTMLQTFRPNPDGYCNPIQYNRIKLEESGTKTGRLTIANGPQVLLLNKKYRNDILVSRFPRGKIYNLDYSALEPRTLLVHAGEKVPLDLYGDIAEEALGDRSKFGDAKAVVIRRLYGAGIDTMASDVTISLADVRKLVKFVNQRFKLNDLTEALIKEANQNGRIKNKFGRGIVAKEVHGNVLLNNWTQSTAQDVANLGFTKIVQAIQKSAMQIVPMFMVHDALFLDVHPDCEKYLPILQKIGGHVPELDDDIELPMKCERIKNDSV